MNGEHLVHWIVFGSFVVWAAKGYARRIREAIVPGSPAYNRQFAAIRVDILRRDGYRCRICGTPAQPGAPLHVHHLKARVVGGTNDPSNLITLCPPHHRMLHQ
jgi:5-methylcytosine-specific restriction endonuclease McrA